MIAQLQPRLRLRVPPLSLLSRKKQAADVDALWRWIGSELEDRAESCVAAIVSLEMLVYGGLLPSRLHQQSEGELGDRIHRLTHLKSRFPQIQILASNLIMRTPAYSSSEEEPDYYADHGEQIFRWGYLNDKRSRQDLSAAEMAEWEQIDTTLPRPYREDYCQRRAKNLTINQTAIQLVSAGIIDFLAIPQDDCAPYGFTAQDQQVINRQIEQLRLQQKVHVYPGADEVGCTLLARVYSQLRQQEKAGEATGRSPQIYPLYSAVGGDRLIPRYEDRPLGESLKAHVLAAGGSIAHSPESADIILAINSPGQVMQEAWDQEDKEITYQSHRNLRVFVDQIDQLLQQGKPVALADVAFANGGETELVQLLDDAACWDRLLAYGGWNTCCNTLGTAIATALLGWMSLGQPPQALTYNQALTCNQALTYNKIYRLLEDWAYQSRVRQSIIADYLPSLGASYYDFNQQTEAINQEMARRLQREWNSMLRRSFQGWRIEQLRVSSPWQRMFEIGLMFQLIDVSTH